MKLCDCSDAEVSWRQRPAESTESEQRAHFSLWAMLASAPLLAGNDIRTSPEYARDPDRRRCHRSRPYPSAAPATQSPNDARVLAKPLSGSAAAVVLFNPDSQPAEITTSASAAGLQGAPCYTVRDLWAHTQSTTAGEIKRTVAPHDVANVFGSSLPATEPASTSSTTLCAPRRSGAAVNELRVLGIGKCRRSADARAHLRRHAPHGVLDDVRFTLLHAHSEDEQGVARVQSSCHGLHDLVPLRQADVRLHDGNDMQFL